MAQRIKGSEVAITVVHSREGTEESIGNVTSFEMEFMQSILSEGMLGHSTELKDDIFRGVRGRLEVQLDRQDYLKFVQRVTDRSQRRNGAGNDVFNILATLNFPNGDRPRVQVGDVAWGSLPVNVGGRDEYVSATLEFEASSARVLFS